MVRVSASSCSISRRCFLVHKLAPDSYRSAARWLLITHGEDACSVITKGSNCSWTAEMVILKETILSLQGTLGKEINRKPITSDIVSWARSRYFNTCIYESPRSWSHGLFKPMKLMGLQPWACILMGWATRVGGVHGHKRHPNCMHCSIEPGTHVPMALRSR